VTEATLFAFLCVFVRGSALLLSSPVFGAQSTPVTVRVMTVMALSGALTAVVQPKVGPMPTDLLDLGMRIGNEVLIGLLIGNFISFALQAAHIGGAFMDVQTGLSAGSTVNPINGVSSTVLAQFKFMLSVVIFMSMDGHHILIRALVDSYGATPDLGQLETGVVKLVGAIFTIALQIALPTMGVGMLVDGALGLVNRAVPQMQALQIGMPAKIAVGLTAVGIALPAITTATQAATNAAFDALSPILGIPFVPMGGG
jgi:flagellar biosynthetic protein FliR